MRLRRALRVWSTPTMTASTATTYGAMAMNTEKHAPITSPIARSQPGAVTLGSGTSGRSMDGRSIDGA